MIEETKTMYRPIDSEELKLVAETSYKKWPPRLPEQPIFYPVTNENYARQIAKQWNIKSSGVGYVTKFEVKKNLSINTNCTKLGEQNTLNGGSQRKTLKN